jgi:hypothetical protein
VNCPGCAGALSFERFGVWSCAACGRFDADGQKIVEAAPPPQGAFAAPPPSAAPTANAPGVPARVVGGILTLAVLVWIALHVWANTRDGVLDRQEVAYIAGRTLLLPFVAFYYRSRQAMAGSGWFLALILLGAMLGSAIPGGDRIAGWLMLTSAIGFLSARKEARLWGRDRS